VSAPELVAHLLALAAAGDPAVTATEHLGRPAWRLETPVTPNAVGGGPDQATVVVDQETALLVLLEERAGGELFRSIEVTSLETSAEPLDAEELEVDGDADVQDEGFERTTLDALLAGAVGDAAVVPGSVPAGFELATVDVQPGEGATSGPEGSNPASVDTSVLVYRRGWEELVVTSRRTGDDQSSWDDPYRGEGQLLDDARSTVRSGALAGAEASLVLDPTTTPHVWIVHPDLVVTVSSSARVTPEALLAVVESLERPG
jgi:hypothetical protein